MITRPPRTPSVEEIRAFEDEGVVRVRGIFDDDWVGRMRRAVDDVLAHPSWRAAELKPDRAPGRFAYDNYLWTFNDDFRAMAYESPVGELAAAMMRSARASIVFDFILVKEPHTPAETRWHQDIQANPCEGIQTCGMWISLDHVTPQSGAVEWIRGSHRWGRRFEAVTTGDPTRHKYLQGSDRPAIAGVPTEKTEPMPDIAGHRREYDIVAMETWPGDCLISSLSMVHGAPGNATDSRRRAFGYRFAGDDATYAVRPSANTIRPWADPRLHHGDPFPADREHPVFPMVWPRAGTAEVGAV